MTTRRDFLGLLGAGAALPALAAPFPDTDGLPPVTTDWDLSWLDRIQKPHKVVIDSPAVSDGGALYRAVMLREQYHEAFGTYPDQFGLILVIRHSAIPLAMGHEYWEKHGGGEEAELKNREEQWVTRNPIGPAADEASAGSRKYTIPSFIESGGVVLCCDLALRGFIVPQLRKTGVAREAAYDEARRMLIPGIVPQPSGFFAVIRAQQAGCALFCNG